LDVGTERVKILGLVWDVSVNIPGEVRFRCTPFSLADEVKFACQWGQNNVFWQATCFAHNCIPDPPLLFSQIFFSAKK
jgi:hypothetical protein